jgi:hypothetical protein
VVIFDWKDKNSKDNHQTLTKPDFRGKIDENCMKSPSDLDKLQLFHESFYFLLTENPSDEPELSEVH